MHFAFWLVGSILLRILASYEAKTAKISNFGIFLSITLLIYHLFKIWKTIFWTMVSSCKKCIDIQKVTPGGWNGKSEALSFFTLSISALPLEVTSAMSLHFLHLWTIGQKMIFRFLKDALLIELSPRMSSSVSFWHLQDILGDNSVNTAYLKNLRDNFWPMVNRCKKRSTWHFRSDLWWQSWNRKCEKWQTFGFAISALPPDVISKMSLYLLHL